MAEIVNGHLQNQLEPSSIVWYIGSFGCLITFFLIIYCFEWCCKWGDQPLAVPYEQHVEMINIPELTEIPPPPYHLFAPPSYNSNFGKIVNKTSEGN